VPSVRPLLVIMAAAEGHEEKKLTTAEMQKAAWWACIKGDVESIRAFRDDGLDFNFRPIAAWQLKSSCLHKACMHKHESLVSYLIQEDADVNAQDSNRDTPLHEAARYGSLPIVTLLAAAGADVSATNNDGMKPKDVADTKEIEDTLVNFELRAVQKIKMELEDRVAKLERDLENERKKSEVGGKQSMSGGNQAEEMFAAVQALMAGQQAGKKIAKANLRLQNEGEEEEKSAEIEESGESGEGRKKTLATHSTPNEEEKVANEKQTGNEE